MRCTTVVREHARRGEVPIPDGADLLDPMLRTFRVQQGEHGVHTVGHLSPNEPAGIQKLNNGDMGCRVSYRFAFTYKYRLRTRPLHR